MDMIQSVRRLKEAECDEEQSYSDWPLIKRRAWAAAPKATEVLTWEINEKGHWKILMVLGSIAFRLLSQGSGSTLFLVWGGCWIIEKINDLRKRKTRLLIPSTCLNAWGHDTTEQLQVRLEGLVLSSMAEGSKHGVMWVVLREHRNWLDVFPYTNQMFSSTGSQCSCPGAHS